MKKLLLLPILISFLPHVNSQSTDDAIAA